MNTPGNSSSFPMSAQRWFRLLGSSTALLAVIGFATVADDLRHTGELIGTACVLAAGACFLLAGYAPKLAGRLALQWLALAFLLAVPLGAWLDNMIVAVLLCAPLGLALAYLRRNRPVVARQ